MRVSTTSEERRLMARSADKDSDGGQSRYEFRSFGQNFDEAAYRMARLSSPVPERLWERRSEETYIMSRANDNNNVKIRDNKMDIKALVQTVDGLEQWSPLLKAEFPISRETLANEVFLAFQLLPPALNKDNYSLQDVLNLVNAHQDLQSVRVSKHRSAYTVNGTICEVAKVLVNGAALTTVSSESTDISDVKKTLADLKLTGIENINYLQAIKRVIGMSSQALAN